MKKLVIALVFLVTMLFTIASVDASSFTFDTTLHSDYANQELEDSYVNQDVVLNGDYQLMSENDYLALYFNQVDTQIVVYDKLADYYWFSSPTTILGDNNDLWLKKISSPIHIQYTDEKLNAVDSSLLDEGNSYTVTQIENGFKLHAIFLEEIEFDVNFTLSENKLNIDIPFDSIVDGTTIFLKSISVMPYFGASYEDQIAGYFAVASGTGSIYRFKEKNEQIVNAYSADAFTNDYSFNDTWDFESQSDLLLPLYGIVHGQNDQAVSSYVTDGEEISSIYMKPSGIINNYNQINWTFNYRSAYYQNLSDDRTLKQMSDLTTSDVSITYEFLAGDQANYTGISNAYRDYLIANDYLVESKDYNYDTKLFYDMSSVEDGFIGTKNVHLTDYSDIVDNITQLQENDVEVSVILDSYMDSEDGTYYFNSTAKMEDYDDLDKDAFTQFITDNAIRLDYMLWLDTAYDSSANFKASKDAVKFLSGDYFETYSGSYVIDAGMVLENLDIKAIGETLNSQNIIIGLPIIGSNSNIEGDKSSSYDNMNALLDLFSDYNYSLGYQTTKTIGDSDYLYNIPFYSSAYNGFDETIPMLPIVFSGSTALYSTPLSYEIINQDLMLRLVEYNIYPTFNLIGKDYSQIDIDSSFYKPFTTLKDDIIKIDEFTKAGYDAIGNAHIVNHEFIAANVVKVTYSNGCEIIFNYNNKTVNAQGHELAAKSYQVVKGGNNE